MNQYDTENDDSLYLLYGDEGSIQRGLDRYSSHNVLAEGGASKKRVSIAPKSPAIKQPARTPKHLNNEKQNSHDDDAGSDDTEATRHKHQKPWYKKKWFIMGSLIVAVILFLYIIYRVYLKGTILGYIITFPFTIISYIFSFLLIKV